MPRCPTPSVVGGQGVKHPTTHRQICGKLFKTDFRVPGTPIRDVQPEDCQHRRDFLFQDAICEATNSYILSLDME